MRGWFEGEFNGDFHKPNQAVHSVEVYQRYHEYTTKDKFYDKRVDYARFVKCLRASGIIDIGGRWHMVDDPSIVPLLGYYALMRVNSVFYPAYTTDQTLDNLCFAIEQANKAPKCHPIEKELGELAIEAIDLQRPYLESAQENAAVVDLSRYRKVVRL